LLKQDLLLHHLNQQQLFQGEIGNYPQLWQQGYPQQMLTTDRRHWYFLDKHLKLMVPLNRLFYLYLYLYFYRNFF
jgi:hypothetical protein